MGAVSPNLLDKTRFAYWTSDGAARNSPEYASGRLNRINQPAGCAMRENPISQQPRLTDLIIIAPYLDRPIPPVVARLDMNIAGADSRYAFG